MEEIIINFVNAVQRQDNRNVFAFPAKPTTCEIIAPLYNKYEPIDIEIALSDLTAIRFYPSKDFDSLSAEYGFDDSKVIIFASWEGDPIYVLNSKIYIAPHGGTSYNADKEFPSLLTFLDWIIKNMRAV